MRLFIIAVVLCVSSLSVAAVVVPENVRDAVVLRIADVAQYSRLNQEAPGAVASWGAGGAVPGTPVLVHAYPGLTPSYYYVPVLNNLGEQTSFVTLGADDGCVQAYGELRDGMAYPAVGREEAAELASTRLGRSCLPDEFIAVSMPNRNIYWHLVSAGDDREFFLNLGEAADIHTHLDKSLVPPDVTMETPPEAKEAKVLPAPPAAKYPSTCNLSVPHHYQGTSYHCGPASVEMILDYWGPDVNQTDIGYVANCTSASGSYSGDNRRAGHFSNLSTAILDGTLQGYDERWLGYGCGNCWWSYPSTSDPDYTTRYSDLHELIYAGYPIEILTWYDSAHNSGHFRVIKGYDDNTNVFIVHDPWYSAPYQGPDVHFNQIFLVDDLWGKYYRWGLLMAPWKVEVSAPSGVVPGTEFTLSVDVFYRGPHPFDGQYLTSGECLPVLPPEFTLAPGETNSKPLAGLGLTGTMGSVSWQVVAGCSPGMETIGVSAFGQITGASYSYASYTDVIGGEGEADMEVLAASRVIHVDAAGGGAFLTIQEGIDDARCDGELVQVSAGSYTGTGNKNIDFGGKSLTVSGGSPTSAIIDCQNSGRAFYFHSGEDTTAVVSGFTIAAGNPSGTFTYGGGVYCDEASPKFVDVVITDNTADYGGGIAWHESSPVLKDVYIINNHAAQFGGGIYALRDSLGGRLEDVDIVDNTAGTSGGGIYGVENIFSLYDVYLHGNSAQFGGAMYIGRSSPTITRAHFQYNTAARGAAMFIPYESEAVITGCTIVHNTTTDASCFTIQCDDSQPTISRTIMGYNYGGSGVMGCVGPKLPTTYHSLSYGNVAGDDLCGNYYDNLFCNPVFCAEPQDDFTLYNHSKCLPSNNQWAVQIGVYGAGCSASDVPDALSTETRLEHNQPNPFNPMTVIGFTLPSSQHVRLTIYDVKGRLLVTLVDEPRPAGRNKVVWPGRDVSGIGVASGVYFYRLEAGGFQQTRSMMLIK